MMHRPSFKVSDTRWTAAVAAGLLLLALTPTAPAGAEALCSSGPPAAAEILLPKTAVVPGGELAVQLRPAAEISEVSVRLIEQGTGAPEAAPLTERFLGRLEARAVESVALTLPQELRQSLEGRLPARGQETAEAESKLVQVEVTGLLASGERAYSGLIVAFEPLAEGGFEALALADYINRHGGTEGVLDTLPKSEIAASEGKATAAEPVHQVNRFLDADGTVVYGDKGTATAPTEATITVTVWGYIYFQDSNGVSRPLPYAEVAVWEDDGTSAYASWDNILLTSSSGYFSTTVVHDDGDSSLELFLRVRTENTWIRMGNYYDNGNSTCSSGNNYCGLASSSNTYQWTGPLVTGVTSGSRQMNYTVADSRKGSAQIFTWLMDAGSFTRTAYEPGQVRAVFGAPNNSAFAVTDYNYNLVFAALYGNRNSHDVPYHEHGHTTLYRRNGYRPPNAGGSHDPTLLYAPGLAWSEGFATGYAQFVNPDGNYDAANFAAPLPIENAHLGTYYGSYTVNASDNSQHNESWVAAALNDLYDTSEPAGGDDPANRIVSFPEVMELVRTHNLDSIIEFYNEMLSSGYLSQLEKHYASRVLRYNEFNVALEPAPQPLSVTITRVGTWNPPQVVYAHASGGTPPYVSYAWYRKPVCSGGGGPIPKEAVAEGAPMGDKPKGDGEDPPTEDLPCTSWSGPYTTSPPDQWTPYQGPNQNIKVTVTDNAGASYTAYSWAN
jgi:hypothetical protein